MDEERLVECLAAESWRKANSYSGEGNAGEMARRIRDLCMRRIGSFLPSRPTRSLRRTSPSTANAIEGEIRILLDAASKKRTAPAPNGVHYRILGKSIEVMCAHLSALYTECFAGASFPKQWKLANFVLLEKPGRNPSTSGAYRPFASRCGA